MGTKGEVKGAQVIVHKGRQVQEVWVQEQESLLDRLVQEVEGISAVCGGKGRCGKCKVQVLEGEAPITEDDKAVLEQEELEAGWRLSCRLYPSQKMEIVWSQETEEENFEILTAYRDKEENASTFNKDQDYDVAVDIGTTTVVLELLGAEDGRAVKTVSTVNGQRRYGADVISRIQASTEGKKKQLQDSIQGDLKESLAKLAKEAGISRDQMRRIVIGGNTTMGHLLMGYDCNTLGVFPFTPVNVGFIRGKDQEILGSGQGKTEVTLLPGVSAFVGGDIVSGMYACGFHEAEELCLLIDLGTNGEMAVGNKDRILVTSTAAGPAFEGGNITWGVGSVAGAICGATYKDGALQLKTIGDAPPVGICGTGLLEIAAELLEQEIISETGSLDKEYFEGGYPLAETPDQGKIVLTQHDVRELQLAKAAIRAGLETLLLCYGVEKKDVGKVYLAGGFGYKMDIRKAMDIGMLPKELDGRVEAVGNSSLAGAEKYLREKDAEAAMDQLISVSKEINLAAQQAFSQYYMEAMFFEADL